MSDCNRSTADDEVTGQMNMLRALPAPKQLVDVDACAYWEDAMKAGQKALHRASWDGVHGLDLVSAGQMIAADADDSDL